MPLITGPLLLLLAPLLLMIVAQRRNDLVRFVALVFDLLATPFTLATRALNQMVEVLGHLVARGLKGLRYSSKQNDHDLSDWSGWDLIGPLVYLMWFLLFLLPDWYVSALRFAAMLGIQVHLPDLPISLEMLVGIVYVTLGALWGFVLLDAHGATPIGRPWHNLSQAQRHVLRFGCWVGLALTIAGAALLHIWGQLQLAWEMMQIAPPEPFNSGLGVAMMGVMAVLLTAASALAGWAVFTGTASVWILGLMFCRKVLWLVRMPFLTTVHIFRGLANVFVAAVDLPAGFGKMMWNWVCKFAVAKKVNFTPLVFIDPPVVGRDVDTWLFPPHGVTVASPSAVPSNDGQDSEAVLTDLAVPAEVKKA